MSDYILYLLQTLQICFKTMVICNIRLHVILQIYTNVLHETVASIFRVEIKLFYNKDRHSRIAASCLANYKWSYLRTPTTDYYLKFFWEAINLNCKWRKLNTLRTTVTCWHAGQLHQNWQTEKCAVIQYLSSWKVSAGGKTHLLLVKCVTWLSVTKPFLRSSLSRHSIQLHEHLASKMSNSGVYCSSSSKASTTSCENSSFSCDLSLFSPPVANKKRKYTWILSF